MVATEARVNTVPFSPSPEAMEEVKVLTGSYSAEYGFNSGAQLVMVMRSGTNELHGAAYEFLRNDKLDAEGFFQNYFTPPGQPRVRKTALRQNQFGAVLGGPVWIPKVYNGKNRTFFLFNYEGRRRREPGAISTALVPSDAFRSGDFSALLNRRNAAGQALPSITIVDPTSDPASPTPFPGNVIPQSRLSPTAKALLDFWPRAQNDLPDPLTGVNFRNPGTNSIDDDQYFVKIDHSFSAQRQGLRPIRDQHSFVVQYHEQPELRISGDGSQPQSGHSVDPHLLAHRSSTRRASAGRSRVTTASTHAPIPASRSSRSASPGSTY